MLVLVSGRRVRRRLCRLSYHVKYLIQEVNVFNFAVAILAHELDEIVEY